MKLKKILFIVLLTLGISVVSDLKAQHCEFDGSAIMVVQVKHSLDSMLESSVRITFLDSARQPVLRQFWNGESWYFDTVEFWQNPTSTTHRGPIDNSNPLDPWKMRFWFASDNYVYVGGVPDQTHTLNIEFSYLQQGRRLKVSKIVSYSESDIYPLCSSYSRWKYGKKEGFIKGYHPILISIP